MQTHRFLNPRKPVSTKMKLQTWNSDMAGLPGKERPKSQKKSLVYVDRNKPVTFVVVVAVGINFSYDVVMVVHILKGNKKLLQSCENKSLLYIPCSKRNADTCYF